jgi:hypothetical protein
MSTPFNLFPNDFNIGKDASGRIFDDSGNSRNLQEIGHVLSIGGEVKDQMISVKPISFGGVVLYESIWEGIDLHFRFTRARGNVEFMVAQLMENFFNLDARPNFSFLWQVLNRDQSIDQFSSFGMKFSRPNLGTFSADRDVEQELRMTGGRFKIVGANAPSVGASPLSF